MNNVSHIITAPGGNTVRFNFEHGNIITRKLPELTLRGQYYQDLLEESELFARGLVRLRSTIEEPSDKVADDTTATQSADTKVDDTKLILEESVRTNADLINFVNTVDNRTEKNAFTTAARALKWATEHFYKFPNYDPD